MRRKNRPEFLVLSARLRAQACRFEAALVAQAIDRLITAHSNRRALESVARVAQRHLGRSLKGLAELYEEKVIAAVVADDRSLDGSDARVSGYTLRQRRVAPGRLPPRSRTARPDFRGGARHHGPRAAAGGGTPRLPP